MQKIQGKKNETVDLQATILEILRKSNNNSWENVKTNSSQIHNNTDMTFSNKCNRISSTGRKIKIKIKGDRN